MSLPTSPFLLGAYERVRAERHAVELPVTGRIPDELDGLFTLIGPNPVRPPRHRDVHRYTWFTADGMVSGVRLRGGRAEWARTRWIGSSRVTRALGRPRTPGPRHFVDDTVHTNVVYHGGMLLALVESGCLPCRLTPDLDSVEYTDLRGALPRGFTGHPKLDPTTGELIAVARSPLSTTADYLVFGPGGELTDRVRIPIGTRPMMHDIAITPNYVILLDFSVRFSLLAAARGIFPFRWDDHLPARLGVLSRARPHAAVRWFELPPAYVFHTINAVEANGRIVVDAGRYDRVLDGVVGGGAVTGAELLTGLPWRWTIDLAAGTVREEQTDDIGQELPRIDPRRLGRPIRYVYALSGDHARPRYETNILLRRDVSTGTTQQRKQPDGLVSSEAVFIPGGYAEDDGWVLHFVHDPARDVSSLIVLAAQDFTGPPVATIDLPFRIPVGWHASWITAADLAVAQAALSSSGGRPS